MPKHSRKSEHSPPSQRQLRVGELIRHKLAELLARGDIHDDVLASHVVTVPEVKLSPDLKLATIYIVSLGGTNTEAVIEALERIFSDSGEISGAASVARVRPRYHYIILDYLCQRVSGEPAANSEISDLAFVRENELEGYQLTPAALRVLHRAFAMARERA